MGLGASVDETPVDGRDVQLLGKGEDGVEGAAGTAGHVLGAEDGAVEGFELLDAGLELFWPAVVVEGEDVGLGELDFGRWGIRGSGGTSLRARRRW